MARFTQADDLAGAEFVGTDLHGARFALHPIGVPFPGWRERLAGVVDLDATPSYEEVLDVRSQRVGMVRDFLATLTDDTLDEQRDTPAFVRTRHVPVRQCLWIVVNEEWHHHRYAVRDLDGIGAGGIGSP